MSSPIYPCISSSSRVDNSMLVAQERYGEGRRGSVPVLIVLGDGRDLIMEDCSCCISFVLISCETSRLD